MRAFAEATPAALDAPMPEGMMGDVMKTKGAMAAFMLTGHPFGHLGQISTWAPVHGPADDFLRLRTARVMPLAG